MFDYVTHAIVRILDAQQRPVGAGCLVRERLIVTCAHVVADALDILRDVAEAPAVPVALDLPFVPDSLAMARVIVWWPYREAVAEDRRHDLALLELEHPLDAAEPARLLRPGHERPGPIQVYGFPMGAGLGATGDWIEGRVTPLLPNGWLKLVQRDQQARFIEPGCSGGPVVIDDTGLVAGIVSLRRSGSGPAEAYGISAALIREALASRAGAGGAKVHVVQDRPGEGRGTPAIRPSDRPVPPKEAKPEAQVSRPRHLHTETEIKAKARVFLAHAGEDKPQVRQLYEALKTRGFAPWLDEVDLLPGQLWRVEIPKAIREAGVFLACLSSRSVAKQGYVQNEFRTALTTYGERPAGSIWLIPVKLDDCEIPDLQIPDRGISLRDIQWLDLDQEQGLERLIQAIEYALPKARGTSSSLEILAALPGEEAPTGVVDVTRVPELRPPATARSPLSVIQDHPLAPKLVVLPRGEFLVGSADGDPAAHDDEKPQHRVRIDYDLAMGQAAVTFEEWDTYAADVGWHVARHVEPYGPDDEGWGRGPRPVINVSWEDIQGYLRWLSDKTGHRYRLPSEAEWEYACRAGTTTAYHFGSTITHYDANFGQKIGKTTDAISYSPNAWGLYNMHGNVWEWVEDCWNESYEGAPVDGSAWLSGDCVRRVVRGGSWFDTPGLLRSAFRSRFGPDFRFSIFGFRVARTLTP